MANEAIPPIVEAMRMQDGVIVTFENGASAVYSTALLYSMMDKADVVSNAVTPPEKPGVR